MSANIVKEFIEHGSFQGHNVFGKSLLDRFALAIRKVGDLTDDIDDAAIQCLGTFCDRSKTSSITTITDVARKTFAATTDDKFTAFLDLVGAILCPGKLLR
jgi:hypothetical protein